MIQVITAGDPYAGSSAVYYVLQCPAALDLKIEWEKYEKEFKAECGPGPMTNPQYYNWVLEWHCRLEKRYQSYYSVSVEIPENYLLTHCFAAQMVRDHGCEVLEFTEVPTED